MSTHHTVGPSPRLRNPHYGLVRGGVIEAQRDFSDAKSVLEQRHGRVVVSPLVHDLRGGMVRRSQEWETA